MRIESERLWPKKCKRFMSHECVRLERKVYI